MAQLAVGEHCVVGRDEGTVAPPVDCERGLGRRLLGGIEVGEDVGAAEGVDGLLRIADEDERGAARPEGPPHDVPLHRIGVLELVDEDDLVAFLEPPAGDRAAHRIGEGVAKADQHVVVGQDLREALAPVDLGADGLRQPPSDGPRVTVLAARGQDGRRGVAQHLHADLECFGAAEHQVVGPGPETADVQVVDHLVEKVLGVLDEGDVAFDVARRAEPGKDLHAEPVRGLDRGGVEVGDGLGKPFVTEGHLLSRTVGQQPGDVVVWVGLEATEGGRQRLGGTEEPVPDPFA